MKDKAKEIRNKVMDRVQTATRQLHGVEDEMQKLVKTVQERLATSPADGLKRLDDLLKTVAVTDFLEKLKAIEVVNKGGALRSDLLDRFGLATREEVDALIKRVKELEKKAAPKKAGPKKAPAKKPAAKK